MPLTSMKAYLEPPPSTGSDLPFDGIIEYSRNESDRKVIKLRVIPTPNDASIIGDSITIKLYNARRNRDQEITQARITHTFTGPTPTEGYLFEIDLTTVTYNDIYRFPVIRRGMYFFSISDDAGGAATVTTPDFRVCLMSVEAIDKKWLLGATRRSNDDRFVSRQPIGVTGVRFTAVIPNHTMGRFPLTLHKDANTPNLTYLSWAEGELVPIDTDPTTGMFQEYELPSSHHKESVVVQVNPILLPSTQTTENMSIDKLKVERKVIREWIDAECDWFERSFAHTPIEPALVVTDYSLDSFNQGPGSQQAGTPTLPENYDYDLITKPSSYVPPSGGGHWLSFSTSYRRPILFEYLVGALESTRIIDIPTDWINTSASGFIELVPFNQSVAYQYIGLLYSYRIRGPMVLPNFWRSRYWAGIQDPETPGEVLDLIGMRAAVKGLTILGQMFRGGFSSQSISRGGISQSTSYTASATYGIYSATLEEYKRRLEALEPQIKRSYMGISLTVI